MEALRAIIVDDEEHARKVLKIKLKNLNLNVEILADTDNCDYAIQQIKKYNPDIIFLDIEMPEMNGFELLKKIPNFTGDLVFVTAYDQYAIEAFKYCALGYILKPIDSQDLKQTVTNIIDHRQKKWKRNQASELLNFMDNNKMGIKKLCIPSIKGFQFIELKDICYCKADDKYTYLFLANNKKIISSKGLNYYIDLLTSENFFSTHRSYLVNLSRIEKYSHDGWVILTTGEEVPVSRRKKAELLELIGR